MKIKTAELTGPALDCAVLESLLVQFSGKPNTDETRKEMTAFVVSLHAGKLNFRPGDDWSQAGPLIDKYDPIQRRLPDGQQYAELWKDLPGGNAKIGQGIGPDRLIAFCRALVDLELGDEVDVPDELVGGAA